MKPELSVLVIDASLTDFVSCVGRGVGRDLHPEARGVPLPTASYVVDFASALAQFSIAQSAAVAANPLTISGRIATDRMTFS